MIKLSEMVFELEQENTKLSLDEIAERATEQDPVFVDKVVHLFLERMASKAWGNTIQGILLDEFKIKSKNHVVNDSSQMYIKYEDAMGVLSEALFQYHYLVGVQAKMNELGYHYEEDLKEEENTGEFPIGEDGAIE